MNSDFVTALQLEQHRADLVADAEHHRLVQAARQGRHDRAELVTTARRRRSWGWPGRNLGAAETCLSST